MSDDGGIPWRGCDAEARAFWREVAACSGDAVMPPTVALVRRAMHHAASLARDVADREAMLLRPECAAAAIDDLAEDLAGAADIVYDATRSWRDA